MVAISTATATITMAMPMPSDEAMDAADMPMGMSSMAMTFFESATTPLFWDWWTPRSGGQYAATCVFLIVLAVTTRVMFALGPVLNMTSRAPRRHHHHPTGAKLLPQRTGTDLEESGGGEGGETGGTDKDELGFAPTVRSTRVLIWGQWGVKSILSRLNRGVFEALLACLGYFLYVGLSCHADCPDGAE